MKDHRSSPTIKFSYCSFSGSFFRLALGAREYVFGFVQVFIPLNSGAECVLAFLVLVGSKALIELVIAKLVVFLSALNPCVLCSGLRFEACLSALLQVVVSVFVDRLIVS